MPAAAAADTGILRLDLLVANLRADALQQASPQAEGRMVRE